jgi:phenylacetate-CoA ligase
MSARRRLRSACRETGGAGQDQCAAYALALADMDPAAVAHPAPQLAALPVTRKSALIGRQAEDPPLGGCSPAPSDSLPGLRLARADRGAGGGHPDIGACAARCTPQAYVPEMLLHNCFAYHFTPAGSMLEGGARALGCPVFPAGTGNTEMQARAAAQLRPRCYSRYTGVPEDDSGDG